MTFFDSLLDLGGDVLSSQAMDFAVPALSLLEGFQITPPGLSSVLGLLDGMGGGTDPATSATTADIQGQMDPGLFAPGAGQSDALDAIFGAGEAGVGGLDLDALGAIPIDGAEQGFWGDLGDFLKSPAGILGLGTGIKTLGSALTANAALESNEEQAEKERESQALLLKERLAAEKELNDARIQAQLQTANIQADAAKKANAARLIASLGGNFGNLFGAALRSAQRDNLGSLGAANIIKGLG